MRIIGVIPARYKSSRFPGKPLVDILGKPMIWWVYQQCMRVSELDEVYVATDDDRIKATCKQYSMNVIMTSNRHQTGTDRVAEVAARIEGDFFVNIQGDEPLIDPASIKAVIDVHMADRDIEVINTMTKIKHEEELKSNAVVKVAFNDMGRVVYLSRSVVPYLKNENGTMEYYRHMGLYGLTKDALQFFSTTQRGRIERAEDIEMFRFIENGVPIRILAVDSHSVGVDRPEDIQEVEKILLSER